MTGGSKRFSITMVDAAHHPDLYAEIECDGKLLGEMFAESGQARLSLIAPDGQPIVTVGEGEFLNALREARRALTEMDLLP